MSMATNTTSVKEVIKDLIVKNRWSVGTRLPSIRELSDQLQINKSTVHTAYKLLEEEHWITIKHGDGAYVTSCSEELDQDESIWDGVRRYVTTARLMGRSMEEVQQTFAGAIGDVYRKPLMRIAFVECSPYDLEGICNELRVKLPIEVTPLLVDDVLQKPELLSEFSLVCTTYYHIQELLSLQAQYPGKILAMHHLPNAKSVSEVTAYSKSARVGLVASNQQTLSLLRGFLLMYGYTHVQGVCDLDDPHALEQVFAASDMVVANYAAVSALHGIACAVPVITIQFHVDEDSIEHLRNTLAAL